MSRPDPDAALIARVGEGDAGAVRQLVALKLPRLLALATRLLGDRVEAEDVAQETFTRAWRQAAQWRPGAALFDTWLHTVALNLCRDRLRHKRERASGTVPDQVDPSPTADGLLDEEERSRAVAAAIAALPERQREAILLVHYQDLGNVAAAEVMEISVEALESLLARGRRTLRHHFAQEGR